MDPPKRSIKKINLVAEQLPLSSAKLNTICEVYEYHHFNTGFLLIDYKHNSFSVKKDCKSSYNQSNLPLKENISIHNCNNKERINLDCSVLDNKVEKHNVASKHGNVNDEKQTIDKINKDTNISTKSNSITNGNIPSQKTNFDINNSNILQSLRLEETSNAEQILQPHIACDQNNEVRNDKTDVNFKKTTIKDPRLKIDVYQQTANDASAFKVIRNDKLKLVLKQTSMVTTVGDHMENSDYQNNNNSDIIKQLKFSKELEVSKVLGDKTYCNKNSSSNNLKESIEMSEVNNKIDNSLLECMNLSERVALNRQKTGKQIAAVNKDNGSSNENILRNTNFNDSSEIDNGKVSINYSNFSSLPDNSNPENNNNKKKTFVSKNDRKDGINNSSENKKPNALRGKNVSIKKTATACKNVSNHEKITYNEGIIKKNKRPMYHNNSSGKKNNSEKKMLEKNQSSESICKKNDNKINCNNSLQKSAVHENINRSISNKPIRRNSASNSDTDCRLRKRINSNSPYNEILNKRAKVILQEVKFSDVKTSASNNKSKYQKISSNDDKNNEDHIEKLKTCKENNLESKTPTKTNETKKIEKNEYGTMSKIKSEGTNFESHSKKHNETKKTGKDEFGAKSKTKSEGTNFESHSRKQKEIKKTEKNEFGTKSKTRSEGTNFESHSKKHKKDSEELCLSCKNHSSISNHLKDVGDNYHRKKTDAVNMKESNKNGDICAEKKIDSSSYKKSLLGKESDCDTDNVQTNSTETGHDFNLKNCQSRNAVDIKNDLTSDCQENSLTDKNGEITSSSSDEIEKKLDSFINGRQGNNLNNTISETQNFSLQDKQWECLKTLCDFITQRLALGTNRFHNNGECIHNIPEHKENQISTENQFPVTNEVNKKHEVNKDSLKVNDIKVEEEDDDVIFVGETKGSIVAPKVNTVLQYYSDFADIFMTFHFYFSNKKSSELNADAARLDQNNLDQSNIIYLTSCADKGKEILQKVKDILSDLDWKKDNVVIENFIKPVYVYVVKYRGSSLMLEVFQKFFFKLIKCKDVKELVDVFKTDHEDIVQLSPVTCNPVVNVVPIQRLMPNVETVNQPIVNGYEITQGGISHGENRYPHNTGHPEHQIIIVQPQLTNDNVTQQNPSYSQVFNNKEKQSNRSNFNECRQNEHPLATVHSYPQNSMIPTLGQPHMIPHNSHNLPQPVPQFPYFLRSHRTLASQPSVSSHEDLATSEIPRQQQVQQENVLDYLAHLRNEAILERQLERQWNERQNQALLHQMNMRQPAQTKKKNVQRNAVGSGNPVLNNRSHCEVLNMCPFQNNNGGNNTINSGVNSRNNIANHSTAAVTLPPLSGHQIVGNVQPGNFSNSAFHVPQNYNVRDSNTLGETTITLENERAAHPHLQFNNSSNFQKEDDYNISDIVPCDICKSPATLMCSKCCLATYCSESCANKDGAHYNKECRKNDDGTF